MWNITFSDFVSTKLNFLSLKPFHMSLIYILKVSLPSALQITSLSLIRMHSKGLVNIKVSLLSADQITSTSL